MPKHPLWFLGFQSQPAYRGATHEVVYRKTQGELDAIRMGLMESLKEKYPTKYELILAHPRSGSGLGDPGVLHDVLFGVRPTAVTGTDDGVNDPLSNDLTMTDNEEDANPVPPTSDDPVSATPAAPSTGEKGIIFHGDGESTSRGTHDDLYSRFDAMRTTPTDSLYAQFGDMSKHFDSLHHTTPPPTTYNGGIGPLGNVFAEM